MECYAFRFLLDKRFRYNLIRMKLTILMLVFFIVQASAGIHAQQITLSARQASLEDVMSEIRKQSGYNFIFRPQAKTKAKKVTVSLAGKDLQEALDIIFRTQDLHYNIVNKSIVLSVKNIPRSPNHGATLATQSQRTITGKVTDSITMEPLSGATVWITESTQGTSTDVDGNFTLQATGFVGQLSVSLSGYVSKNIVVGDRNHFDIKLSRSTEAIDEVQIVGFGEQRKVSVIGAISTITREELRVPATAGKISNMLAGRLAGVVAVQRGGGPGNQAEFYIRGISTFGANRNPLVLVDGVERDINSIDPEDIASFAILKDATATAVYGVRGANGVILITTRKGTEGKPTINARVERGYTAPTKLPSLIDAAQWAELYNEASGTEYYSPDVIERYRTNSDPIFYPNVNWIETLYNDYATNDRLNINISGGGNIARYFISSNLYQEGSILKEDKENNYSSSSKYSRANFRANLDLNLTPNTTVSLNLANLYEKSVAPGAGEGNIWTETFRASPNAYPVRFPDGKFSGPEIGSNISNPYNLLMQSGYQEVWWNYSQALATFNHKFDRALEGLNANVKFSWDAYNSPRITRTKQVQTHAAIGIDEFGEIIYQETNPGQESLGYSRDLLGNRQSYLEASLTYEKLLADRHRIGGLMLFNQNSYSNVASGTAIGSLPYRRQGLAGRVTYSYDDRYFVEGNFGYNGSENFAPGSRFGFFPSGAVGWMVSNERFWTPISDVVNSLKFRASYGLVGNDQIGGGRRFIYEATVVNSSGYVFGETQNYNPGAIRMGEIANPNVSWERSYKANIGAEFSLFNRLDIQADYFNDRREGIFIQRNSLPGIVGLSTIPWVNLGQMNNQGFDGQLEFKSQINQVSISALGNFTYTRNKILYNDQPDWKNLYQNRVGKPFGQTFGLHALGLFESQEEIDNSPRQDFGPVRPGDIKYADINGDGVVNGEDEIAIGRPTIPEIVYGFGLNFRWKNFDAAVFFQGISNTSLMVSGSSFYPFSSGNLLIASINQDVYKNRWHIDNPDPNAKYPRLSSNQNINNNRTSSFFQHDASFIRLKNADFGYTIPKRWIDRAKLSSMRLYVSGTNLLTFSNFKLWDPERGGGQGAGYPPTRILLFGTTISL